MTEAVVHLSTDELDARFRAADTVVERTHFQVIWLLAKGRTVGETAEVTAISERWVSKLRVMARARLAICGGAIAVRSRFSRPTTLRLCGSGC